MKKNVFRFGLMASILLWGALLFTACRPGISTPAGPTTDPVGTMVAATLTAFPSPTVPTATSAQQTYSNLDYGFAFDYPPGWEVTETIVPPGTKLTGRSHGRYDIGGGILLIELTKGPDWILEFQVSNDPAGLCHGGQGPVPDEPIYQTLDILGRKAARFRPEDGQAWNPPEQRPLSTVPVMFYKLPGECTESWPEGSIPAGQVVFLWGFTDPQTAFSIDMGYYSNQFTAVNLQNRSIDYAVIHEMDQIVQSLRFTR